MARFGVVVFIFFFSFAAFMSNTEGRKLSMSTRAPESDDRDRSSVGSFASLARSALPEGRVTSSCPGKKGHATLDNEQILARHLASIDRILRSVPSPGVGN
ncbi:PRECURSOR OF CEP14 [Salix purpurea]|uniref:PRECURSOR OF CEP14 n=1 Tax=Salix purpurea TaxID=77065 RepID=A0A9Q1AG63_SALPP|nr:PRECURSOR OF CEP14 [Salix purpurea]